VLFQKAKINGNLFVGGSIYQSFDCFSDLSRGRQFALNSLSALLCVMLPCLLSQWTTGMMDEILMKGYAKYLKVLNIN